ncbi:MAG: BamA/TamA family outer membrane protein [Acidobacteriota bacterium]
MQISVLTCTSCARVSRRVLAGVRVAGLAVACAMLARPGLAQEAESRAAELQRQRELKATDLRPHQPRGTERLLLWLENRRSWERLLNPAQGLYPKIGTITPGGGLGLGAGFRKPGLFNQGSAFTAVAMASFQAYWLARTQLVLPELANGRLSAVLAVEAYDYANEAYYGPGPDSSRQAESFFGIRNTIGGGQIGLRVTPHVTIGGGIDYLMPVIDRARKSGTVQDRFTPFEVPGLDRQPDFGHYMAFAEVNTREPRGNPRVGGLYSLRYERFDDVDLNAFNFHRVDAEIQQYLSLFNQRRVLALRGLLSVSAADDGQRVPFYLQRTLGGPNDLRGFLRNRFRDDCLLVLQAEYRWEVFTAMDAALFMDWGKVAASRQELDLDDLEHDYGVGVRFGTNNGVFLRIEGAFGSRDGGRMVFSFGNVF